VVFLSARLYDAKLKQRISQLGILTQEPIPTAVDNLDQTMMDETGNERRMELALKKSILRFAKVFRFLYDNTFSNLIVFWEWLESTG